MALTEETKTGTGTSLNFSIEYVKTTDIKVRIDGGAPLTFTTSTSPNTGEYHIVDNTEEITFGDDQNNKSVYIYRETNIDSASAVFTPGSSIKSTDLNQVELVTRLASQEGKRFDQFDPKLRGELDMTSKKITELANPTASTDATNKTYVDTKVSDATATLTYSGESPPSDPSPSEGDRWFDTNDGRTYVYLNSTWIDSAPQLDTAAQAGIIPDGNKGDISVDNSGSTWTINSSAVDNVMLSGNISLSKITINDLDIATAKLANDAGITADKIGDDQITADKLKDDDTTDSNRAVTTNHIRDNAVTLDKLEHKTEDDILVYRADGVPTAVSKGSDGDFLKIDSNGNVNWVTVSLGTGSVTSIAPGLGLLNQNDTQDAIEVSGTLKLDAFDNSNAAGNKAIVSDDYTVDNTNQFGLPVIRGDQVTHLNASNLHTGTIASSLFPTASTAQVGVVQLTNTAADDESKALTPKALQDNANIITGATSNSDGTTGLVPPPDAGEQGLFLKGDGNWDTPTNTVYSHPTTAGNIHIPSGGSSGQFLKYSESGTAVWANDNDTVYSHPTSAGNIHIPSGGASGQVLKYSASGTAVWGTDNNTTYSTVTTSAAGLVPQALTSHQGKFLRADGSYARPLFLNVKDFGALGDNSNDDASAIQSAIDSLNTGDDVITDGGVIYFPPGIYKINSALTFTAGEDNITLLGTTGFSPEGGTNDGGAFIRKTDTDIHHITITNSECISIQGLTFDTDGDSTDGAVIHAVSTGSNQRLLIEKCYFKNFSNGIRLSGYSDCTIKDIYMHTVKGGTAANYGIKLERGGDVRQDQIRVENVTIDTDAGSTGHSSFNGFVLDDFTNTSWFQNCAALQCKRGFVFETSMNNTGPSGSGSDEGAFHRILNCDFENSASQGIYIQGGTNIWVSNCYISDNEADGMEITSDFVGCAKIIGNDVRINGWHGIRVNSQNHTWLQFTDNNCQNNGTAQGNTYSGIHLNGDGGANTGRNDIKITGGVCGRLTDGSYTSTATAYNQKHGISVHGEDHQRLTIIDVDCSGNRDANKISYAWGSGSSNSAVAYIGQA
mgnify:CR=1 FL=1